jgi:aminopeptidase N
LQTLHTDAGHIASPNRRSLAVAASVAVASLMPGCQHNQNPAISPGITVELAEQRAASIRDLRYEYALSIPGDPAAPVEGSVTIRLTLNEATKPLVIDFAAGADHLELVVANGRPIDIEATVGHIVVPAADLEPAENRIEIAFRAGDGALNRNPDFLYSLFVPARAHHAVPIFDQPDLKARFTLELTVPAEWHAIANGAELSRDVQGGTARIRYAETEPIPSYLFAFAAGRFTVETAVRGGREYRMFHRETDAQKVARNRDAVFDLHAAALEWLEQYTAIPYPFGKFDFLLIPSFQFNGMEHPGAIYYRDTSLLLDESATENQTLDRARLIAHETAHMWFGDLVTMRWFDDVWMKEVFANFMAAKIVDPAFPQVPHDLRFLLAHHPRAYAVDRTAGTHSIRQPLDNLDDAGTLYGPIIYQKAPIVMRQLERLIGVDAFRDGLRGYLERFAFGNASWLDLVEILDPLADFDVAAWSRAWVEEAGRPTIRTEIGRSAGGTLERIALEQSDPLPERNLLWAQRIDVLVASADGAESVPIELVRQRAELPVAVLSPEVELVLPPADGLAYGRFELDPASREFLLERLPQMEDPIARGAAWITLWDEVLAARVAPMRLLTLALTALPHEDTEANVQLVLQLVERTFWKFLPPATRAEAAAQLEGALLEGLANAQTSSLKAAWFNAFRSTVTTRDGRAFLERIWRRDERIEGLVHAETDEAAMALELAVRDAAGAERILGAQLERFENPDRRARFEFVMPALSAQSEVREAFFAALGDPDSRRREPWVVEALGYLNHPLRAAVAEPHLRRALELLPELQRTGDIFFPANWTNALLAGHSSSSAASIVREFLNDRQDLPDALRRVVLQSADELFRAAEIVGSEPIAAPGSGAP